METTKRIPIRFGKVSSDYSFEVNTDIFYIEIYEDNYLIHDHFIAKYGIDSLIQ